MIQKIDDAHSKTVEHRLVEIDVLRFLAAAVVALYHWTYRPVSASGVPSETAFGWLQQVSCYGYLGVDLFFLISGFVIFWSANNRSGLSFLASRISRLYPTFWICVLLTCLAVWLTRHPGIDLSLKSVVLNLTMIPEILGQSTIDRVYWTLVVELKFYFWVLMALFFLPRRHFELALYVWLAVTALTLMLTALGWGGRAASVLRSASIYPFAPLFIAGALNYMIWRDGPHIKRYIALAFCLAFALIGTVNQTSEFMVGVTKPMVLVAVGLTCMSFALVLSVALGLWRLPVSPVWVGLGALTYPLYLLHNQIGKVIWTRTSETMNSGLRLLTVAVIIGVLTLVVTMISERRLAPLVNKKLQQALRKSNKLVAA